MNPYTLLLGRLIPVWADACSGAAGISNPGYRPEVWTKSERFGRRSVAAWMMIRATRFLVRAQMMPKNKPLIDKVTIEYAIASSAEGFAPRPSTTPAWRKMNPGACAKPEEEQRHQNDAADFRTKPDAQARLQECAKEKFLNEPGFDRQPDETKRQPEENLMNGEFAFTERRGAAPEKILKGENRPAQRRERPGDESGEAHASCSFAIRNHANHIRREDRRGQRGAGRKQ